MTKITNKSPGPRGVNTEDGVVILSPGESRDLKVSADELKSLSDEWFVVGSASKADKIAVQDAVEQADGVEKTAATRTAAEADKKL